MSVARYPFSLTVHLKNGSQLFLERAMHLNGEWEMCITQVCIPKSQITIFRDCFMTFNYDLQPKTPAKTEKDRLWKSKLRKLSLRERQRSIRITLPAGSYDNKAIIEIINNTIQNDTTIQSFREDTKFDLSTGKTVYLELPKIIDSFGRTAIQLQEEINNVSMSRELSYLLGFVNHPTKGEALITIQNTTKHALLSSHQRPSNGGIFYYFLYCNLIEYQSIGNQKAPLLRIMPADENNTSQVETIQFEHLYYYKITKDIISHIAPEILSEFGELIQFKYADPLYVFHFRPIGYGIVQIEVNRNVDLVQILLTSGHIYKMYDLNPATYYTHQLKGNLNYPIYQSGRGLGSRLFNIVKSIGAPLLKEIILPTVNAEAGQVML